MKNEDRSSKYAFFFKSSPVLKKELERRALFRDSLQQMELKYTRSKTAVGLTVTPVLSFYISKQSHYV